MINFKATNETWELYLENKRRDLKIIPNSIVTLIVNEMNPYYDPDKKYLIHCSPECIKAVASDPRAVFIGQLKDTGVSSWYILFHVGRLDFVQDIKEGYKIEEL